MIWESVLSTDTPQVVLIQAVFGNFEVFGQTKNSKDPRDGITR